MHSTSRALIVGSVALLALTACSAAASPGAATSTSSSSASPAASDPGGYPRSVANCGHQLTVTAPPRRIASLNQASTETLITLGVGDRIVGTSTWFDPILANLSAANAKIPRIADNNPSLEALLATEPDFVAATWQADLPGEGSSTIESLGKLGLPVYMSPTECEKAPGGTGNGRRDKPLTMDIAYREISELGGLVGASAQAEKLNAQLRAQMDAVAKDRPGAGKSVAFWFANGESPYVAGGVGAPAISAKAVGLNNVFADSHDEWPQVSWEAFAQKDPDVLVLGDLTRKRQTTETGAAKIALLESNPVTKQMKAVKNRRYIMLHGADMTLGIRTPSATEKMAAGLKRLGLAG